MKRYIQYHTTYNPVYSSSDLLSDITDSIEYKSNSIKIKLLTVPAIFNLLVDKRNKLVERNQLLKCRMWNRYNNYVHDIPEVNFIMFCMSTLHNYNMEQVKNIINNLEDA